MSDVIYGLQIINIYADETKCSSDNDLVIISWLVRYYFAI